MIYQFIKDFQDRVNWWKAERNGHFNISHLRKVIKARKKLKKRGIEPVIKIAISTKTVNAN